MNKEQEAKPLTLEEYAGVFHNPNLRRRLSHDQLNQIIFMHGFVRLHRWQKANILEALNSLDLMHPERSTMREEAPKAPAAAAVLSLEEVKRDVQFLGWQECPLGSIVTVGAAGNVAEAAVPISSRAGVGCHSVPGPVAVASGGARLGTNGKKKRKRMLALAEVARRTAQPPPILPRMSIASSDILEYLYALENKPLGLI
ncbi:hypothetical protein Cni_G20561 [Canna indica]|uniref:DUF7787 domain-containing protein n=1 Tax=Canna indica TaxID=4628 RepID=A0AAQ3KQ61_9LILI|nr:hypothetical protein Cni_G20561 [Canna indica]